MTSTLEVRIATPNERLPLYRMLELYQHDLSDIWDQDIDTHGEYGYTLDRYWNASDCWPYLFLASGKLAGFALVDRRVRIPGDDFWMDQFFVLKKYRRQGIGSAAAATVLDAHQGHWQVGQMPANLVVTLLLASALPVGIYFLMPASSRHGAAARTPTGGASRLGGRRLP
jgi:predicted acetyltransferase